MNRPFNHVSAIQVLSHSTKYISELCLKHNLGFDQIPTDAVPTLMRRVSFYNNTENGAEFVVEVKVQIPLWASHDEDTYIAEVLLEDMSATYPVNQIASDSFMWFHM